MAATISRPATPPQDGCSGAARRGKVSTPLFFLLSVFTPGSAALLGADNRLFEWPFTGGIFSQREYPLSAWASLSFLRSRGLLLTQAGALPATSTTAMGLLGFRPLLPQGSINKESLSITDHQSHYPRHLYLATILLRPFKTSFPTASKPVVSLKKRSH